MIPSSLAPYVTGLWGLSPRLAVLAATPSDADVPSRAVLTGGGSVERVLHLPLAEVATGHAGAHASVQWAQAAASHAAAHWRFGGPPIPRGTLKQVQLALLGVLEDARVESLAVQQLPGLRALWLRFHTGPGAAEGSGFEALLGRLARSLLDPHHRDPHPWVARARAVFFASDGVTPALQTAEAVRHAASLLGNDIGQMRLPFNPRTYRVHAAYRDDNSHLWADEPDLPTSDTPLEASGGASVRPENGSPTQGAPQTVAAPVQSLNTEGDERGLAVFRYPEWDRRIGRYRAQWCSVFVRRPGAVHPSDSEAPVPTPTGAHARHLQRALSRLGGRASWTGGRLHHGDELHMAALVDAGVDRRMHRTPDPRVYRRIERTPLPLSVCVLLDISQSTDQAPQPHGMSCLEQIRLMGHHTVSALQALGHPSSLWSFASWGRLRIDMTCIKSWQDSADALAVRQRLAAAQSGGSTRLAPAVRHAGSVLLNEAAGHRHERPVVLVVTDGELHDIDVHEPGYLRADLQRAVRELQPLGVRVMALCVGNGRITDVAEALGPGAWCRAGGLSFLAPRLSALLAGVR